MIKIRREYEMPVLLGAGCALLTLVVLGEWRIKTWMHQSVRDAIELQAHNGSDTVAADQVEDKSFHLARVERFSALVKRPLFFQGRRIPVRSEAPKADKPFDAQLHGVVAAPGGALALLKDKDGKYHRLREKEMLFGWRLIAIFPDRVQLERGAEKIELLLQKPKPKEAAKSAGQGGAADQSRKNETNPKTEKTENETENE
jgi:hypothetical protein